jgi:DNA (cytosine-5)-methyltransferase 1
MDFDKVKVPYLLKDVIDRSNQELFTVVSMFAGVGGSSTGYRLAGGKVLAINEFIEAAQKAYHVNYPDTKIFTQDIRTLTGKYILRRLGIKPGDLDILDGSPPCSSFSVSGKREKGWGKEKKYSDKVQRTDDLFFEFARILKEIQPKVFICENVKGITIGAAKYLLDRELGFFDTENDLSIINALKSCGYQVRYKVLNAKYYGVSQRRERTIFIGVRNNIKKEITFPVKQFPIIPVKDIFVGLTDSDIDKETDIEKYAIYNEAVKNVKPGSNSTKYFNLCKIHPDQVSFTITATSSTQSAACPIHWDNRKLSVKETIRICSFPDDYYLGETFSQKIERLGRAVPPLMMKAIAEHVYNTILK